MNRDQVNRRLNEEKGKVKEKTGKMIDNADLTLKGEIQKSVGKVQAEIGDNTNDTSRGSK